MRGLGYWAIGSGLVLLLLAAAFPLIAEWQLRRNLPGSGAEPLVTDLAQELIEDSVWRIGLLAVLGVASVAAGVLLLARRDVWRGAYSAVLALAVVQILSGMALYIPVFR